MKIFWKKAKEFVGYICIVDRFLILFMLILFFYMAIHLFTGANSSPDSNSIDIIIRTSAAAIFGYFISNNFATSAPSSETQNAPQNPPDSENSSLLSAAENSNFSSPENTADSSKHCNKIQICMVSVVGIFSLSILLLAKHYEITPELAAMISQLRDFISASIGFLISCKKNTAS